MTDAEQTAILDSPLWSRYKKGTAAFDRLYSAGKRCPSNLDGARCLCLVPRDQICLYWQAVVELDLQLGLGMVEKIQ